MKKVSIIGFGRFGAMLHTLLSKGFEVEVYDKNSIDDSEVNEVSLKQALKNETIFIDFLLEHALWTGLMDYTKTITL